MKIKTFVGTPPNAVKTQIWTALIAILLLRYLQLSSKYDWSLSNLHVTGEVISGNAAVSAPIGAAVGTVNVGIIRDFADLDAKLQLLETEQKANIISNPKITTVNNREASVVVGQQIPLIVQDFAGNAVTQLTTIGIQMRVTPHVNSDRTITLDLHPEVSELSSQTTVQGGVTRIWMGPHGFSGGRVRSLNQRRGTSTAAPRRRCRNENVRVEHDPHRPRRAR